MIDDIRNILDPASTLSDDEVLELLHHAQKKKTGVWATLMFFRRHNKTPLAEDWLREQNDKKLSRLADVLPRLFKELDDKPAVPAVEINLNRNEQTVNQNFGKDANSTVVNL